MHEGYGLAEVNVEDKSILDFLLAVDLTIANTKFRKRDEHLFINKSRVICSQIDFCFIWTTDRKICLDSKVVLGESLTTQHRFFCNGYKNQEKSKEKKSHGNAMDQVVAFYG